MIPYALGDWAEAGDGGSDRGLGHRASSGGAFGGGRSVGNAAADGGFRCVPADPGACGAAAKRAVEGWAARLRRCSEMQNAGVAIAAWLGAGADGVLGA